MKETFLQYCTRRTGCGRTGWGEFIAIQGSIITMALVGIVSDTPFAYLFAAGIEFMFFYGTYKNWKGEWK